MDMERNIPINLPPQPGVPPDAAEGLAQRLCPEAEMEFSGPAAFGRLLATAYDPAGERCRGAPEYRIVGRTPWGTWLAGERRWARRFHRATEDAGSRTATDNLALYAYGLDAGHPAAADDQRWDCSVRAADATADYRNEPNTLGWLVECDPRAPEARPCKRTALGRLVLERAWLAPAAAGRPVVAYLVDKARPTYVFKYESDAPFDPADRGLAAGDKYLDHGALYVARADAMGGGEWIRLAHGASGLTARNPAFPFANQGAVLVHARLAADLAEAPGAAAPRAPGLRAHRLAPRLAPAFRRPTARKREPMRAAKA